MMCTVQEAVSVIKNHIKMVADLQVLQYLSVGILFILCFPRCLIFGDLFSAGADMGESTAVFLPC